MPGIWPLEVANVLVVAERAGRLERSDSVRFVELLRSLPILVEQEPADRVLAEVMDLARETNLSSYDASYLDLAMRAGAPLATQDKSLRHAAKHCGIALV